MIERIPAMVCITARLRGVTVGDVIIDMDFTREANYWNAEAERFDKEYPALNELSEGELWT